MKVSHSLDELVDLGYWDAYNNTKAIFETNAIGWGDFYPKNSKVIEAFLLSQDIQDVGRSGTSEFWFEVLLDDETYDELQHIYARLS